MAKDIIGNNVNRKEENMHKEIVPILHSALWFFGLFSTKYAATILKIDANNTAAISLVSIIPAFLVFIFEIAVTYQDVKVSYGGRHLKMEFTSYVANLIGLLALIIMLVFIYALKPHVELLFVLLMILSVVLKNMEYRLLNNMDKYLVKKPEELNNLRVSYDIGYQKK